jgi:tetratricopeptide (TPR) repeat protein
MKIGAERNGKDPPHQKVDVPVSRIWWLAAIGVIAALSGVVVYWLWDSNSDRRDEALRLAKQGHHAEAEPLLLAAFERNANDAEVVAALALIKHGGSDPANGEKYLSRWCELRPSEARPFQLRMDLRHRSARGLSGQADRLHMMETALADGRRVLELDPLNDAVRREVAWLALQIGRYAEAEAECRQCLADAPLDGWMTYLLAKICHAQGKRKEAETIIDPVVRAQPGFGDVLLLRAQLFYEADQPDRAIPLLRQALALPECPRRECLYRLGLALAATGQAEEARKTFAEVDLLNLTTAVTKEDFPNNPAMRVQIAEAMIGAGRLADARAELEAIIAESPHFAPAHRAKAAYHDRMGQPDQAAEHRRRAGDSP